MPESKTPYVKDVQKLKRKRHKINAVVLDWHCDLKSRGHDVDTITIVKGIIVILSPIRSE